MATKSIRSIGENSKYFGLNRMRASSTGGDKGEVTVINGGISIRARGSAGHDISRSFTMKTPPATLFPARGLSPNLTRCIYATS